MSRRPSPSAPPRALMVALLLCLTALLLGYVTYPGLYQSPVQAVEVTPTPAGTPDSTATGEDLSPAPLSTGDPSLPLPSDLPPDDAPPASPPPYDYSRSVPPGTEADSDTWFQDAVFIGDSRTDGLHLFSGITGGTFLVHTGMSVFDVVNRTPVLGPEDNPYSVLSALSGKQYGKVYVSLGVNELGYSVKDYAEAFDRMVDDLRDCQPDAVLYVQAIIPVCTQVCKAQGKAYYVNNDNIAAFNDALIQLCEEKEVFFLNVSEALVDPDTWELPADMTFDGIHLNRSGYQTWLRYLLCHTGDGEWGKDAPLPVEDRPVPPPPATVTPAPLPSETVPPVTVPPEPHPPETLPPETAPAETASQEPVPSEPVLPEIISPEPIPSEPDLPQVIPTETISPEPTPSEELPPEIPLPFFTPAPSNDAPHGVGMPPAAPEDTP